MRNEGGAYCCLLDDRMKNCMKMRYDCIRPKIMNVVNWENIE